MFDKLSPGVRKLAMESFMEVRPVKIHHVALPPRFIFENYSESTQIRHDAPFGHPEHTITHFQIDVRYGTIQRRYYGQHYHIDNSTYIHDVWHKSKHEFRDGAYQNLVDFHKGNLSVYHKMLIEYYVFKI